MKNHTRYVPFLRKIISHTRDHLLLQKTMNSRRCMPVLLLVLCAALAGLLGGCGNKDDATASSRAGGSKSASVNEVLEAGMEKASEESISDKETSEKETPAAVEGTIMSEYSSLEDVLLNNMEEVDAAADEDYDYTGTEAEKGFPSETGTEDGIDLDLTQMSATMVYSEVFGMMMEPDQYIGKIVKMRGDYTYFKDALTEKYYTSCVIQDATACCAQGVEFVLTDDYHYPEDYPEEGSEITVIGEFSLYQEGEYTFCTLKDARLV